MKRRDNANMFWRHVAVGTAVALLILLPARSASASEPWHPVGLLPGLWPMSACFGFVNVALAAFLERPFVSQAGVCREALAYSIRANLLSYILWTVLVFTGIFVLYQLRDVTDRLFSVSETCLWAVLGTTTVIFQVSVEGLYCRRVARSFAARFRWRWIVIGNVVSNVVLAAIALALLHLAEKHTVLSVAALRYYPWALWGLGVETAGIILYGVIAPITRPDRID